MPTFGVARNASVASLHEHKFCNFSRSTLHRRNLRRCGDSAPPKYVACSKKKPGWFELVNRRRTGRSLTRRYYTLRIPASVAEPVHNRLTSKSTHLRPLK